MKSATPGRSTSQVEVTNVSTHGFWILIGAEELFAPFREFPWFKDASIAEITCVELPSPHHLYWPELDIDLAVESLIHPERYPLVSQAQPKRRSQRASRKRVRGQKERPAKAARG